LPQKSGAACEQTAPSIIGILKFFYRGCVEGSGLTRGYELLDKQ
jgi:hypothetical protein